MLACFVYCIINQSKVSNAIGIGIDKCITTIIPSLFPSIVLSTIISKSGFIRVIASNLPVDSDAFEVFILGNIGGYPTGAKVICDKISRGEISREEGEKMLKYSYNSGPAFCIGIIGKGIFHSSAVGLAIYITEVVVNATLFIISQTGSRKVKKLNRMSDLHSTDITASVISSLNALFTITAYIMFFAVIILAYTEMVSSDKAKYFTPILDITTLINAGISSYIIICLFLCFGGICVITQVSAISSERISLKDYYISFIYKLPLCLIYSRIAIEILDNMGIAVNASTYVLSKNESMIPFACVVFMVIISISEYKKLPSFKREQ